MEIIHTQASQMSVTDKASPPIKAKKKHIVLFVIACVLLVIATLCAGFMLSTVLDPLQLGDPEGDPLATGAVLLVGMAYVVAMGIVRIVFFVSWPTGAVIMVLLAVNRGNKPKWLWVASLAGALFSLLPAVTVAVGLVLAA
ncbi:MAG: hypothetical protein J6M42_10860 [Clostridia bacterium]|nr:hypothetical protein [Clostridia bacterium]